MYSTRIKQWKINKNYRAQDKEALAARIALAQREKRPVDDITYHNRPIKFDRIVRHFNTQRRQRQETATLSSVREQTSESSSESSEAPISDLDSRQSAMPSTNNTSLASTPCPSQRRSQKIAQLSPIPAKHLKPPVSGAHVELILHQTKNFYDVMSSIHIRHDSPTAKTFWTDVKSAIYYLKKDTARLAWPLLNNACRTPIAHLVSVPITFLRELFSTLSPVNTNMHAPVRVTLLRYLRRMCHLHLGQVHPITLILTQLELDSGTRYASETCLQCLLSLLSSRRQTEEQAAAATPDLNLPLPSSPTPNDNAAFQTQRQLTILLRRDHDLASSINLGNELIACAPTPQDRAVAMLEVVHILSDMCDYDAALTLCQQVLDLYKGLQGKDYPDSSASYAMEAMAELCRFQGDSEQEERWLREAANGAKKSRGVEDSSTVFVRGKLEEVVKRRRSLQEANDVSAGEVREEGITG